MEGRIPGLASRLTAQGECGLSLQRNWRKETAELAGHSYLDEGNGMQEMEEEGQVGAWALEASCPEFPWQGKAKRQGGE